ncbi:MAG: PDZ domain-containing protein [Bacteroidia bacterium]|nr:PDZ domain-containing protein [Bacteroidia bacterium]
MKKIFTHVETEPKIYSFTLKTKITDILFVKAKINNRSDEQNFMFDTGAPLTYKFTTKDSFNIQAKKLFRLGPYKTDFGSGSINLGNVKFNNAGFLVTDQILGEYKEVEGIIGASMLQTSICEINFADSTIKISNDINNFKNIENCYSSVFEPLGSQGTPIVKIVVGKDTANAFIDTGYSGIIRLNDKINIPSEEAEKQEMFSSKKDIFTYYQLHRLDISGIKMDTVILGQDKKYGGYNCIGLTFLKKFIVTIDWIHHRIYFKPIKAILPKQILYTYGFTCLMKNNQLRVYAIYKDSPAEKAGLKIGDVIVSINQTNNFSDSTISNINAWKLSNDSIRLEIKDKPTITLKKYKLFN